MLKFNKDFSPEYGEVTQISQLIRRLVAPNPSPFTFHGTGTYIIGTDNVAIIDPGPEIASHLHALETFLEDRTLSHILITHNHMDHSPAAAPLKQVTGAEIYAFDVTGQAKIESHAEEGRDRHFKPDHIVKDGDMLSGPDWTIDVIHTPGHLSNHVCFALREEKALFSGDHVMGWSTSVVSQPDGDMQAYLTSLEKLLPRDDVIYYPTHGAPIHQPQAFVQGLIDHRHARETQILAILDTNPHTIAEMVEIIYCDVPSYLHPAAASSVFSHLIHMVDTGRVICKGPITRGSLFYRPQTAA
ncbi:MBL fold metallo-hydrolase [Paremcibacter congregatus]|uniref:MBL fold metallo-hydrolase n=1 Tax=Paremcibacter congregatus TaxID=2043170 RepID=UPI003A8EB050